MKKYYSKALIPLILYSCASKCMISKELPSKQKAAPCKFDAIKNWPRYLYDDASPGTNAYTAVSENFGALINQSSQLTRLQANQQSLQAKEMRMHDWVYTLFQIEKTLLLKPFIKWDFDDLVCVARMLTRLSNDEPGLLRKNTLTACSEILTEEKIQNLASVQKDGSLRSKKGNRFLDVTVQLKLAMHLTKLMLEPEPLAEETKVYKIFSAQAFIHDSILRIFAFCPLYMETIASRDS